MRKSLSTFLTAAFCLVASGAILAADAPKDVKKDAVKKDGAKDAKPEEPKQIPSWFKLLPDTADDWTLTPDPADDKKFTLMLKEPIAKPEERRKVLVLFFKPSSSYDTALGKIANVFQDK